LPAPGSVDRAPADGFDGYAEQNRGAQVDPDGDDVEENQCVLHRSGLVQTAMAHCNNALKLRTSGFTVTGDGQAD
jgi:hypothetical protein